MAALVLNSGRCSHGRCFFCGYGRIRGVQPTSENLKKSFDIFFKGFEGEEVKVYGSGSFFDEKQVTKQARKYFIEKCRIKGVKKIQVESRPEYVESEIISEFRGFDLSVAMGLEVADDDVLEKLDKGYTTGDYEEAAKTIHKKGAKVRTYLLVNPPFVEDVSESLRESVKYCLDHSDTIVLINTLPHSNSPLMRLWVCGEWNFLDRKHFRQVTEEYRDNTSIELEEETFRFTPNFPQSMRENLEGVGENYLTHPHIEAWQDYIIRWYEPGAGKILLFLPCSFRKPYSRSKTHRMIIEALGNQRERFHEIMLSSAGVIPREFENMYPFQSYDWDEKKETQPVKERYIEVTCKRILDYLTKHGKYYNKIACFLKYDSESYKALEKACDSMGCEFRNLLTEETYGEIRDEPRPLQSQKALDDLGEGVKWCLRNST